MSTFLIVFLIGVGILVLCFLITLRVAHVAIHHPSPPAKLPNGDTIERATTLARESKAYQNYLVDRLLVRSEERHRGQRR
jgi:hypothetical protein